MQYALCAIGSIGLHVALLAVLASVSVAEEQMGPAPRHRGPPLIASLVFIEQSPVSDRDSYGQWLTLNLDVTTAIEVAIPRLPQFDAIAADSFEKAQSIQNLDDAAEVQRLQAVYVKQINSRIERLLNLADRQHARSNAPCVIYVAQDEAGAVLDVQMDECAREAGDQQRLASAIRAASPLPPPPVGLAMGSYLRLDATEL